MMSHRGHVGLSSSSVHAIAERSLRRCEHGHEEGTRPRRLAEATGGDVREGGDAHSLTDR
jgi:hypothetical protein